MDQKCEKEGIALKCKKCHCEDWELIWFRALMEEGLAVNMYQCKNCMRVVMATEEWKESDQEG